MRHLPSRTYLDSDPAEPYVCNCVLPTKQKIILVIQKLKANKTPGMPSLRHLTSSNVHQSNNSRSIDIFSGVEKRNDWLNKLNSK